jgi:hypothetical protein
MGQCGSFTGNPGGCSAVVGVCVAVETAGDSGRAAATALVVEERHAGTL